MERFVPTTKIDTKKLFFLLLKFYPAVVAAVTDKTYAVQFKGYGNIEEVLKQDCFSAKPSYNQNARYQEQNNFSGKMFLFLFNY